MPRRLDRLTMVSRRSVRRAMARTPSGWRSAGVCEPSERGRVQPSLAAARRMPAPGDMPSRAVIAGAEAGRIFGANRDGPGKPPGHGEDDRIPKRRQTRAGGRPRSGGQRPRGTSAGRPGQPAAAPPGGRRRRHAGRLRDPAGGGALQRPAPGFPAPAAPAGSRCWSLLGLLVSGFAVPGLVGAVALLLVAIFLGWLAYLSWPASTPRDGSCASSRSPACWPSSSGRPALTGCRWLTAGPAGVP